MRYFIISIAVILFSAVASVARTQNSAGQCQGVNKKVAALIREYKELREQRRRLPEGIYNKDLRDDGGKLHRVLSSLGVELGHQPYTKRIIVNCLGAPDAVRSHQKMRNFLGIYNRGLKKAEAGQKAEEQSARVYLIYFWRGWHDFLFFISDEDGAIVDHGWWFAYE